MLFFMRKNNLTICLVASNTPHRLNLKNTWLMNPLTSNLWCGCLGHNKKPLKVVSYQPWTIVFWWLFWFWIRKVWSGHLCILQSFNNSARIFMLKENPNLSNPSNKKLMLIKKRDWKHNLYGSCEMI